MANVVSTPRRVRWSPHTADQTRLLEEAAALLKRGAVVAIPTDTVYGLAALPGSDAAMNELYALKGRPREKTIALLVADPGALDRLSSEVPEAARELARRYWPGGLTLVLRSAADPSTTVALRMPNHPVPLRLISEVGSPLATTSANRSSAASPRGADDVLAQLPAGYPLLIDAGPCPLGVDSTVVDLARSPARLLRAGPIEQAAIETVTGPLEPAGRVPSP
jgi:L-threonylcarbamoyladenylate synthase